jgi:putative chitinase
MLKRILGKRQIYLQLFQNINGDNLSKVGQGFKDLASGLLAFARVTDKDLENASKAAAAAAQMSKSIPGASTGTSQAEPVPIGNEGRRQPLPATPSSTAPTRDSSTGAYRGQRSDMPSTSPTPASSNPSEGEKAVRAAASKYGITDETEINALLAQVGHESGNYRHLTELGSKSYFERYEGRRDLGNTQAGDGYKYRGRGYIQLTGRSNYEQFAKFSGLDVVNNPDLVATPSVGAEAALWFWKTKVKPKVKDFSNVKSVTRIVNGGYNGLADREQRFASLTKQSTGSATTLASVASPTPSTGTVLASSSTSVADQRMAAASSGQSVVVNAPQTNVQASQGGQRSSGNVPSAVDTDFMRHLVAQLVT